MIQLTSQTLSLRVGELLFYCWR